MYQIFCDLNPPNGIRKEYGLIERFAKLFLSKFSHYNYEVTKLCSKMLLVIRMRTINNLHAKKIVRNSTKNVPKTSRGMRKRIEQTGTYH